jgi:hypothetical protein
MYAYAIRYILRNENYFPKIRKTEEDFVGIVALVKTNQAKRGQPPKYGKISNHLIRVTNAEISFFERLLARCISELENNGEAVKNYLPNPSKMNCNYCDYKEPCLMVRRGGKDAAVEAWGEENWYRFVRGKDEDR